MADARPRNQSLGARLKGGAREPIGAKAALMRSQEEFVARNASPRVIRCASPSDLEVVQRISADAYIPAYMAVIGAVPKPAHED